MMYKIVNDLAPSYMADMFTSQYGSQVYSLLSILKFLMLEPSRTETVLLLPERKSGMNFQKMLKLHHHLNAFKRKIKSYNFGIDNT